MQRWPGILGRGDLHPVAGDCLPVFESLESRLLLSQAALPLEAVGFAGDALTVEAAGAATEAAADPAAAGTGVLIADVPAYYWYRGCGPTAAGMIIGYWDGMGYGDLVPGDAAAQTADVDAMIASPEHVADYAEPIDSKSTGILPDKSSTGGAHENNSVADWMQTSRSSRDNYYGWSWFSNLDDGLEGYAHWQGYADANAWSQSWGAFEWSDLVGEVDAGRPMLLLVDRDGNGGSDHIVTAIGYDATTNQYAAHTTWDYSVHWYDFAGIGAGQQWGIYGATFFDPGSLPGAPDTAAPTAAVVAADISQDGSSAHTFSVTFSDNEAVDVSALDSRDVRVTGPNGFDQLATFVGVDVNSDGALRTAAYRIAAPNGRWDEADNGTYSISMQPGEVADVSGNVVAGGPLGQFVVDISVAKLGADLRGTHFSALPKKSKAGTTVRATFAVSNMTGARTGSFDVAFYLSSDADITTADRFLGQCTVLSIGDVGTTGQLTVALVLPSATSQDGPYVNGDGVYHIGMIVDFGDGIVETNETNNAGVGLNLDFAAVTIRGTKPKGGKTKNSGDGAAVEDAKKLAKQQRKAEKEAQRLEKKRLKAEAKLAAAGSAGWRPVST